LYGQKQAGCIWNKHLHHILLELGWVQSKVDDCLYYKGDVLFLVYVDDGILVSPVDKHVDDELELLKGKFNISIEGTLSDYVGINIERRDDGTIHMTQPQLIQSVLKQLNFTNGTKGAVTPAFSTTILNNGQGKPRHNADWSYRRLIGKLNFIAASCRPEVSCAVHQAARFSQDPRVNHSEAVKQIARYLKDSFNEGITFKPTDHSFKVWADADFGGLWDKGIARDSPVTAKSRTGYLITYADCPIMWASQLQTEYALSTTEAEYIALSTALCNVIPLICLVKEIRKMTNIPNA
jgi:Reverse transcriptase (RNA-dependent DNA polymerase)